MGCGRFVGYCSFHGGGRFQLLRSFGMILNFVSDFFILLLTLLTLSSFLFVAGCKRITEGKKKTRIGWLVGFLWHINLCRLINTKSIFMQIISSISNNSV